MLAQVASRLCCAPLPFGGLWRRVPAEKKEQAEASSPKEPEHARRWYRVLPLTDTQYTVRADPGVAGRTPGHPDAGVVPGILDEPASPGTDPVQSRLKKTRRGSCAPCADRRIGLDEPPMHDTFHNVCTICFSAPADVVVLPCRHGGMCEDCVRRSLRSRPVCRGGTNCPLCRTKVQEVIKMHDESAVNMYGYAIRVELLGGMVLRK